MRQSWKLGQNVFLSGCDEVWKTISHFRQNLFSLSLTKIISVKISNIIFPPKDLRMYASCNNMTSFNVVSSDFCYALGLHMCLALVYLLHQVFTLFPHQRADTSK